MYKSKFKIVVLSSVVLYVGITAVELTANSAHRVAAYNRQYEEAQKEFGARARAGRAGDVEAQYQLGVKLLWHTKKFKRRSKRLEWVRKAVASGHVLAIEAP